MDSWKRVVIATLALLGNPVAAAENNNPFQAALMITLVAPFVLVSGATALTSAIPDLFKSSKSSADETSLPVTTQRQFLPLALVS